MTLSLNCHGGPYQIFFSYLGKFWLIDPALYSFLILNINGFIADGESSYATINTKYWAAGRETTKKTDGVAADV